MKRTQDRLVRLLKNKITKRKIERKKKRKKERKKERKKIQHKKLCEKEGKNIKTNFDREILMIDRHMRELLKMNITSLSSALIRQGRD